MGKHSWTPEEPFVVDKFISDHHLCHFGIHLLGTQPSSVVYRLLTTKEVPSHQCAHPGEQHAVERELLTSKVGAESQRQKAELDFCKKLVQEWMQKQDIFAYSGADGMVGSATLSGMSIHSNIRLGDYPARKPDFSDNKSSLKILLSSDNRDQSQHRLQKVDEKMPHLTSTKIVEQSCADPIPNFPTDSAVNAKVRLKLLKE